MVVSEEFSFGNSKEKEIANILKLLQIQKNCINQIERLIYVINTEGHSCSTIFQKFSMHFNNFMQKQGGSEGFAKAIHTIQVYHYVLLEKLLDEEVVTAAEELELAVGHLEMLMRDVQVRNNPHFFLLNQSIASLEEVQLNIIETLEKVLQQSQGTQLQN
jgi:signal recognition particle subunit SEC65